MPLFTDLESVKYGLRFELSNHLSRSPASKREPISNSLLACCATLLPQPTPHRALYASIQVLLSCSTLQSFSPEAPYLGLVRPKSMLLVSLIRVMWYMCKSRKLGFGEHQFL